MLAHKSVWDVARIEHIVRANALAEVIDTDDHMTVIWCPNKVAASNVALRIGNEGISYEIRQGCTRQSWYIHAKY